MAWQFDPYHMQVEFAVKHFGMMTVRGNFTEVTASGNIDPDDLPASSIEVTINASSIRTNNAQRDNDVRGPYLLDVEHFPTITFKSSRLEPIGDDRYRLSGDLTIRGVTNPVTLTVQRYGEMNDAQMGHRIAYSAEGEIKRTEFGLTMNMMADGRWVVGDEVKITIELELVEAKAEATAGATG